MQLNSDSVMIWDLDNTLVRCGEYYKEAETAYVRTFSERYAIPPEIVLRILHAIDLESCHLPNGFNRARFPTSFVATTYALATITQQCATPDDVSLAHSIADAVFDAPYSLVDGAENVLSYYKEKGLVMHLLTKGDESVQLQKYDKQRLSRWFPLERVTIVPYKTLEFYEGYSNYLCNLYGITPASCVMIGDSARDDIGPAKKVGFRTIQVTGNHFKWLWESAEETPELAVAHLLEIPKLVHV